MSEKSGWKDAKERTKILEIDDLIVSRGFLNQVLLPFLQDCKDTLHGLGEK
jgi:hypothetical protein